MSKRDVVFKRPFADRELFEADAASCALDCSDEPVLTVQSAKEDADINQIVRRFGLNGELPQARYPASFGDFSSEESFHEAVSRVVSARASFLELPAGVRSAFGNDPGALIGALEAAESQPAVRARLVELGLVNAVEAVAPSDGGAVVAPVAPPAPGAAEAQGAAS